MHARNGSREARSKIEHRIDSDCSSRGQSDTASNVSHPNETSSDAESSEKCDGISTSAYAMLLKKINERPILGKYELGQKLGAGGFGLVYEGKDIVTGEKVAMKLELRTRKGRELKYEAKLCQRLSDRSGFAKFFGYGRHDDYRVLVVELLGPNLRDLFKYCDRKFSLKTVLMIVDQLLERLEAFHTFAIHRDIKPDNCMIGVGRSGKLIYLADYGIATTIDWERVSEGVFDQDYDHVGMLGTPRYASKQAHRGRHQSWKDDLESLGYMMVELLKGSLPWQGLPGAAAAKADHILKLKRVLGRAKLYEGLPSEFAEYMARVRKLRHEDLPDYASLRELFRGLARKEDIKYDYVYDWTIRRYYEKKEAGEFDGMDGMESEAFVQLVRRNARVGSMASDHE